MAIKRMIWSNDIDTSDEAIQKIIMEYKELGIILNRDDALVALYDRNSLWHDEEWSNLDIATQNPILIIADLGLWSGRRLGYAVLDTQNVRAIFSSTIGDTQTFYGDAYNIHCEDVHHDGTNYYLYRELIGPTEVCTPLLDAIYQGKDHKKIKNKLRRYSRSLLPYVADIYGWPVAGRRKEVA